ncbi:MAG: gamma-glutamylcyclotransferase family protein [Candidatus Heimdallarchaeota archaeon]
MEVNVGVSNLKETTRTLIVRMIGYGTFLRDIIQDLAAERTPKPWGEKIKVLGTVKVQGFRRLWPGISNYPIIQKAKKYFFFGILFEINKSQLVRFDQIEGVPTLYTREIINVQFQRNLITAFIYIPTENMLHHTLQEYELLGKKPGFDDWRDFLRKTLAPEELNVFPEIFTH